MRNPLKRLQGLAVRHDDWDHWDHWQIGHLVGDDVGGDVEVAVVDMLAGGETESKWGS